MSKVRKAVEIYRQEGIKSLFRAVTTYVRTRPMVVYVRYLRPRSPRLEDEIQYNGVRVRPYRSLDAYAPFTLPPNLGGHENPANYEYGLGKGLREEVSEGDTVAIVGGGLGVTAAIAAQQAGPDGEVIVYEGAENMVDHIKKTVAINDLPCPVRVRHAIVSSAKRLDGPSGDATIVDPADLYECDILELDCEGAETGILRGLEIRPKAMVIETHGNRSEVAELIDHLGYRVTDEEVAELEPYKDACLENEILVLTAVID